MTTEDVSRHERNVRALRDGPGIAALRPLPVGRWVDLTEGEARLLVAQQGSALTNGRPHFLSYCPGDETHDQPVAALVLSDKQAGAVTSV